MLQVITDIIHLSVFYSFLLYVCVLHHMRFNKHPSLTMKIIVKPKKKNGDTILKIYCTQKLLSANFNFTQKTCYSKFPEDTMLKKFTADMTVS